MSETEGPKQSSPQGRDVVGGVSGSGGQPPDGGSPPQPPGGGHPPQPPGGGYPPQPPGGGYPPQPPGGGYPPGPPGGGYPPQPPGGYPPGVPGGGYPPQPPGGGYGQGYPPPARPARRAIQVANPRSITERNGAIVLLLSLATCGIYYLIWLYSTTNELKEALADQEINPGIDLLLTIVTCFLWSIYVEYRNSQKVHAALLSRDPYAKDQSEIILLLNVAGLFVGATWLVATYLLQEDLNKLSRY